MKIGFISGTGKEGQALAIRFGSYGHSIVIGSRDISKAELSGNQIRNILPDVEISCTDYKQTVLQSDIIFVALPFSVVKDQLIPLKNELKGKYIIDTTVPLSIDKGKFEASEVLGFKKKIYYYKIIIPQMLRLALPNISNVWQITLKDTSLISVTGLVEIMRQSYIAAGSTRDPLFFYSFAAVLYLFLTFLSMRIFNKLEKHYSRGY